MLNELEKVPGIELNISCPNVKEGGMAFGTSCLSASQVVREVRRVYKKDLIVKLSPNVTDISEIARAVEDEGADSVSLINTLLGMAIDSEKRKPVLSTHYRRTFGTRSKTNCTSNGVAGCKGG